MTDTDPYPSPSEGQEPSSKTAGLPTYGSYPAAEQSPWRGPAETGSGPSGTRPWHAPAPPSKALAGWALGLAFLPCLISLVTSFVFAIIVLNRGKDGRDHGKGMAIAALCIVPVWVLIGVAAFAVTLLTEADRNEAGQIENSGRLEATALRVGDCFDLPDGADPLDEEVEEVFALDAIPCEESHQAEVYAVFELPDGKYPGEKQVIREADEQCTGNRFETFVGKTFGRSTLEIYYLMPTKRSWGLDDRNVTCAVTLPGYEPTTGSLRGAKR